MNDSDIKNLDLNLLHTLHVLLEECNVTRAASRLSISQSAVSHALGKLRDHFDDPLLVKVYRGMVPTAEAEKLKGPLSQIILRINELVGKENFDPAKKSVIFRIASSDYGAGIILPRLIELLAVKAPKCKLESVQFSFPIQQDLRKGMVDLAFGGYKPFDGFRHETIFHDRYIGVVRKLHPILDQKITKKQMACWPHAFITLPVRTQRVEDLYSKLGIAASSKGFMLKLPYFMVGPLVVEKSDMIIIMPEMGARMMSQIIDVTLFELPLSIEKYSYLQSWHPRRDSDKMHCWLRAQVRKVCLNLENY